MNSEKMDGEEIHKNISYNDQNENEIVDLENEVSYRLFFQSK